MGEYSIIFIFGIFSFMSWYGCVFTTKKEIEKIGYHKKYYPKRYIMPNRKIRKIFGLKKKEIPKWCHRELLLSFVYIGLFFVSSIIYFAFDNKLYYAQMFIWIYCALMGTNVVYIVVCSFMYNGFLG